MQDYVSCSALIYMSCFLNIALKQLFEIEFSIKNDCSFYSYLYL